MGSELTMAERLFGFSGEHNKEKGSHPFRGLLRFETAWGPPAEDYAKEKEWPELTRETPLEQKTATGWRIALAPLTGPATRAKSRPLYLQPRKDDSAASWEDKDVKLRGRKFYWPQTDEKSAGKVWKFHLADAAEHKATQLPPPVCALKDGTEFDGRIHFRNLTPGELGALVFVFEGDGKGQEKHEHTLRLGKGKPRGLGNVNCEVTSIQIDGPPEALLEGLDGSTEGNKETYRKAYFDWVAKSAGKKFEDIEFMKSYLALHRWTGGQQIRYYPVNFRDYGWLPDDSVGNTRGEPKPKDGRPVAMKRASQM